MCKRIAKRCGEWQLQVANSMLKEIMATEQELSPRHWENFVNLLYDQPRLDQMSYEHMIKVGHQVMRSEGYQEVKESTNETMHKIVILKPHKQVLDRGARNN